MRVKDSSPCRKDASHLEEIKGNLSIAVDGRLACNEAVVEGVSECRMTTHAEIH